jgi:hypothetical protein
MTEKSRSTKWREERIAKGGKAVGVTLNPGAAESLDTLQEMFKWSQREAISFALEFTARHKEQIDVSKHFQKIFLETFNPHELQDKVNRMEERLGALEHALDDMRLVVESYPANVSDAPPVTEPVEVERWLPLLEFTARQMLEHGERVTRSKLFEMARHDDIPIHPSLHEYSTFLSQNMNIVRDIMRHIKEGPLQP